MIMPRVADDLPVYHKRAADESIIGFSFDSASA